MTDMALTMLLRGIRADVKVHGFRSTFRDWVADATEDPNELPEMALAHSNIEQDKSGLSARCWSAGGQ